MSALGRLVSSSNKEDTLWKKVIFFWVCRRRYLKELGANRVENIDHLLYLLARLLLIGLKQILEQISWNHKKTCFEVE